MEIFHETILVILAVVFRSSIWVQSVRGGNSSDSRRSFAREAIRMMLGYSFCPVSLDTFCEGREPI